MTELLSAAQMRAIEQAAITRGDVTGLQLMERAGQGVVDAIFAHWPALAPAAGGARGPAPSADASPPGYFGQDDMQERRAVVLCGPGNNGGDGFVVARLLHALGWELEVFLYGDPDKLPRDARVNYERWLEVGEVRSHKEIIGTAHCTNYGLCIDAIFGTGLTRPLVGDAWSFCREAYRIGIDVAIDLASGFCADSGRFLDGAGDHKDYL